MFVFKNKIEPKIKEIHDRNDFFWLSSHTITNNLAAKRILKKTKKER